VQVTQSPDEVGAAVSGLLADGAEALASCGGDGAAMRVATVLADLPSPPPLAILPGGTMNTICRNLGIGGRPEDVLVRIASNGAQTRPHATIRVGPRVGFMFGAGLVANFFDVYYASPRRGRAYAAAQVARIVAGGVVGAPFARRIVQPLQADVEVDGTVLPWRDFTVFAAGVLQNVGVGLRVLHRAGTSDDAFHLLASGLSIGQISRQAARIFSGRPLTGERHHDSLVRRAVLRFDEPRTYILDGEPFRTTEVVLEPGPVLALVV